MPGKCSGVALCAELVQQSCRAFDVGEEERHGAGRKRGPHAPIIRRSGTRSKVRAQVKPENSRSGRSSRVVAVGRPLAPARSSRLVRREDSCDDGRHVSAATNKGPKGECAVDAVGTAHLTSDILAQHAVGASVSRRQITDVLQEPEGTPELVLDLVAAEGGEHATISMTWSRDDLERLLQASSGDEVVLTFDRDQLTSAFGDVEAHGLRATAAVFTVAAAGALGSGASIANAVVDENGGGTAATPIRRHRPRTRRPRWGPVRRR